MKKLSLSFLSCTFAVLVAGPLLARADVKPNFDEDAKPILSQQPGLLQFVESKYEIKDTGIAKYPGDDDHAPVPPYIFRARDRGSNGAYNVRLLIQPGPPGHILGIVKDAPAQQPVVTKSQAPVQAPANSSTQQQVPQDIPEPTADTPSGPIGAPNNGAAPAPNNTSSLTPPADPAPQPH